MRVDILTLFPDYFQGPFDVSILRIAQEKGLLSINIVDIRDFADNKWRRVDERPCGGGPGMVLRPEPVAAAIRHCRGERSGKAHVVYLTPQGKTLTAKRCRTLAQDCEHLILLCGHYEGIDQRVLDAEVDEEISIGDYVLTNGCIAAIVVVDAVARFVPEVLGHADAAVKDSFEQEGLFDHPHYTLPRCWEGRKVPDLLFGGNHKVIDSWRMEVARDKTANVRPDLLS